jgi:hypothetical protein
MQLLPATQQYVNDADLAVGTSGATTRIFSIELISKSTASTVKVFKGTSIVAGNQYSQVDGIANQSVIVNYAGGKKFIGGCFLQTDANTAFVTVTYTEEF